MLQATHAALIASNEHLLGENASLKRQHAAEVKALQANFDELASEVTRQRATTHGFSVAPAPPKPAGARADAPATAGAGREAASGASGGKDQKPTQKRVGGGGGGLQKRRENAGPLRA